ncbi:major head protein [Colwellia phage 9A]|uniref:Major capsid protein n=1 Tax=Colwellia phage 9A TaxID=765765 RepID=I3UME8_9CAUD|nr:major head protein [Colwellia phage 9A]AFK66663.1 hypothetical protein COPG_00067 [Colwellia phage 9A]
MSPEQILALGGQEQVNKLKALLGGEAGTNGESSARVDAPLSDFSVKVVQEDDEFQARKIVNNFNSAGRQDMYYFYEPAYFMVNQVKERAEGTEAAKAKYGVSRKSYTTKVYALKQPVTDETVANAQKPIDRIYEDATTFVTRQFLLNKEKAFASALLADGVWATEFTGQAAALTNPEEVIGVTAEAGKFQHFDQATSKPLDVFDLAMEYMQLKSGVRPNTVVMTRKVFTALKRNSMIKTTKLYTSQNSASDDAIMDTIASHIGIPSNRIFILDVVEAAGTPELVAQVPSTPMQVNDGVSTINVDDQGYARNSSDALVGGQFIGGKGILLMHIDTKSTGMYSATAAVCCQWTGLYADGGDLGNTVFKRYRKEEFSAEFIEGRTAFSYHIVAPALGVWLKDVVA